jgi:hypothetical protein
MQKESYANVAVRGFSYVLEIGVQQVKAKVG